MIVISAVMSGEQLPSCPSLWAWTWLQNLCTLHVFIHKEQFAFQVHALKKTVNFGETLYGSRMHGLLFLKSVFFRVCRHKADMVRPDKETHLRLRLLKVRKVISSSAHVSCFIQVSRSSNEKS